MNSFRQLFKILGTYSSACVISGSGGVPLESIVVGIEFNFGIWFGDEVFGSDMDIVLGLMDVRGETSLKREATPVTSSVREEEHAIVFEVSSVEKSSSETEVFLVCEGEGSLNSKSPTSVPSVDSLSIANGSVFCPACCAAAKRLSNNSTGSSHISTRYTGIHGLQQFVPYQLYLSTPSNIPSLVPEDDLY